MAYIGNTPAASYTSFAKQDFTTSATTSYTLDNPVTNANELALFINFVRQEPTTAYSASGTSLTLTSATSATDDMYCVFLGKAVQTVNPPNNSVNEAQLNYPLTTFSSTGIDDNATSTAITINSSEYVGIGTSSPAKGLEISGTNNIGSTLRLKNTAPDPDNIWDFVPQYNSGDLTILDDGTERMRIDSSGNVLVGKTAVTITTAGSQLEATGTIAATRSGSTPMYINRLSDDGILIDFRKDSTTVGSIGVDSNDDPYFNGHNSQLKFRINGTGIVEVDPGTFYPSTDDVTDLGYASNRFDNIYATNGTINTSDANEKQSIQSLTTTEMNVAKRLSPLFKTFKWNSAVEEKGDSARTHTGIIAQDVQQAFTDEGLDAGNYALFISDTWWEKEISVEATEEKDAYTYMDTKEEATDGYTERTRLGVRYPELLSFIQAYNDQRFTELEARITALETTTP